MKKLDKKNNKKKVIIVICVLSIILIFLGVFLFINNGKKKEIKEETSKIKLTDNLEAEVNSEVNLLSFISDSSDVEILSSDELVDTSTLGEKELVIKYKDGDKEKEYKFKINIKDSIVPTIEYQKELSTTVGVEIDLLKDVKVTDNSLEEIKASVEGEYDFNKEGTYTLKYVAIDSSNNKTEEEFTLKVNKKEEKKTTTSKTTTSTNKTTSSKTPPKNINPDKEWVDFDYIEENGQTADYKYGTKVTEVYQYLVLKYSDNTEEKVPAGVSYKLDSSNYNGTTSSLLKEATEVVDSNTNTQNEMLKYVNEYRAEVGAEPLVVDRNLSIAATIRAMEIAYGNKFSHTRPDGRECFSIYDELGLHASAEAENIAAGTAGAKATAQNWRNSETHYTNMIYSGFKKIGIGYFKENASQYTYNWVQLFSN